MADPAGWTRLEHITWRCRSPVLSLSLPRAEVEARLGLPHVTNEVLDGIGAYDGWAFRLPCGLELTVTAFQASALPVLLHDHATPCCNTDVFANELDADHLRYHLVTDCDRAPRFAVLREDDNGQRYEVARVSSRCEAEAAVREYTARGHKQLYWVEPIS